MSELSFFEVVENTRAIKRLRVDPVPLELIRRVIEIGTKAPSGVNTQPWEFLVVRAAQTKRWIQERYLHFANERFAADLRSLEDVETPHARMPSWPNGTTRSCSSPAETVELAPTPSTRRREGTRSNSRRALPEPRDLGEDREVAVPVQHLQVRTKCAGSDQAICGRAYGSPGLASRAEQADRLDEYLIAQGRLDDRE